MYDTYSEFDSAFDLNTMQAQIDEIKAKQAQQTWEKVPYGTYEVALETLEFGKTNETNKPKVTMVFRIVTGDLTNQRIFWHQPVDVPFKMLIVTEFLKSLKTMVAVHLPSKWSEFATMLAQIKQDAQQNYEYKLKYSVNKNGYDTFKIEEYFPLTSGNNPF